MMRDVGLFFYGFLVQPFPRSHDPVRSGRFRHVNGNVAAKKSIEIPVDMTTYKVLVFDARVEVGGSRSCGARINLVQSLENCYSGHITQGNTLVWQKWYIREKYEYGHVCRMRRRNMRTNS